MPSSKQPFLAGEAELGAQTWPGPPALAGLSQLPECVGSTGKSSTLGKARGQGKIRTSPGNLSHPGVPRGGSGGNAVLASAWTAPASPNAAKQPQPCQGRGKARTTFPVGEQQSSVNSQGHCLLSSLCCCPSFIPCGNSFLPSCASPMSPFTSLNLFLR